jgi:ribosomal protein L25 (general stress protein Ctc)
VGMLRNLRKKFGEIIKIVFGRNSATSNIIAVERIVFIMRIKRSEPMTGVRKAPNILEKTKPYITSEKLLPINIVAIYCPG